MAATKKQYRRFRMRQSTAGASATANSDQTAQEIQTRKRPPTEAASH